MGAQGIESLEERARRAIGDAIAREVFTRIRASHARGNGVTSIALSRMDYMCLCIASADKVGEYVLVTELYGVPIHLIEELPEGVVVVS